MVNKYDYGIYRGVNYDFDVTNKAENLDLIYRQFLNKTLGAFNWDNLEIPYIELEKILQTEGKAFILELDGELKAFSFTYTGDKRDVYGNILEVSVLRKDLNRQEIHSVDDGVVMLNDLAGMGLANLYIKYASMISHIDTTLNMVTYHLRIPKIFVADDDTTKQSIDRYLKNIDEGKTSSIVTNSLFNESIDVKADSVRQSSIDDLLNYQQYLYGKILNEIGLNEPIQLKKDRLVRDEVLNNVEHKSLMFNMLDCRTTGVELINKKFNRQIEVSLNDVRNIEGVENGTND